MPDTSRTATSAARGATTTTGTLPVRRAPAALEAQFALFVTANRRAIDDYVAGVLRGAPDASVDREGVVQEALVRIWRAWPTWPQLEARRQAYLRRTLKLCALDALRIARGRNASGPREIATDLNSVDAPGHNGSPTGELRRALSARTVSDSATVDDRLTTAAALAALSETERRAIVLSAQGYTDKEVAAQLDVSHQRVRTLLMDGRALLRSLAAHSDHPSTSPADWPLHGQATNRRQARLVRRHTQHCLTCRAADDVAPTRQTHAGRAVR